MNRQLPHGPVWQQADQLATVDQWPEDETWSEDDTATGGGHFGKQHAVVGMDWSADAHVEGFAHRAFKLRLMAIRCVGVSQASMAGQFFRPGGVSPALKVGGGGGDQQGA